MKRFLTIIFALVALCSVAQTTTDTYFPIPIVPDSIQTLQRRSDYLMDHYWDFCDLKKAFSARAKMAESFDTYLNLIPYASAEMAHKSVDRLLKKLEKQPADLLFLATEAEKKLYSDTAEIFCEEIYYPFAKAVVENKKIDAASKARFVRQAKILSQTQLGMQAPEFGYTDRDGNPAHFKALPGQLTMIYFSDPDCDDCLMARLQLSTDPNTNALIDYNILKIYCLTPGEADEDWRKGVERYPQNWSVGATEAIDDMFDIRQTPNFYLIDEKGVIQIKNLNIETVLNVMQRLHDKVKQRN